MENNHNNLRTAGRTRPARTSRPSTKGCSRNFKPVEGPRGEGWTAKKIFPVGGGTFHNRFPEVRG